MLPSPELHATHAVGHENGDERASRHSACASWLVSPESSSCVCAEEQRASSKGRLALRLSVLCAWLLLPSTCLPCRPAQILSKAAARQHLGGVTHKSKSDAPVIFFGTSEIAWIGAKDVTCWETGMAQSFHNKGRKNKKFVVALEQVGTCPAQQNVHL